MRTLTTLLLLTLLTACTANSSTPTPPAAPTAATAAPAATAASAATAVPSSVPTTAPPAPPTPAPSAVPSALPTSAGPAGALPAPLFFIENDQIWRLGEDGTSRTQLTFESQPVLMFAVRRSDNGLVYLVGDANFQSSARSIVALDASGRTVLASAALGAPLPRPGSDDIVFQLIEPAAGWVIGGDGQGKPGVWGVSRRGGRPFAIQLDDQSTSNEPIDPANPDTFVKSYTPLAWSPDGTQLLLSEYPGFGEGALPVIKTISDGTLRGLDDACCGDSVWGSDGLLYTAGGLSMMDARLGLWRTDPATGKTVELLPSELNGQYTLVIAAFPLGGGAAGAFVRFSTDVPDFNLDNAVELIMTRIAPDGTQTALRPDDRLRLISATWAPDASGAVVISEPAPGQPRESYWLAADGRPALKLPARATQFGWGSPGAKPAADACAIFQPLAWQPPASRAADEAVADLQRRLLALGFGQVGSADGFYGDQTRDALTSFQQARGLPTSGNLDCATWQALLNP